MQQFGCGKSCASFLEKSVKGVQRTGCSFSPATEPCFYGASKFHQIQRHSQTSQNLQRYLVYPIFLSYWRCCFYCYCYCYCYYCGCSHDEFGHWISPYKSRQVSLQYENPRASLPFRFLLLSSKLLLSLKNQDKKSMQTLLLTKLLLESRRCQSPT